MVRRCTRRNESSCSAACSTGAGSYPDLLSYAGLIERSATCNPCPSVLWQIEVRSLWVLGGHTDNVRGCHWVRTALPGLPYNKRGVRKHPKSPPKNSAMSGSPAALQRPMQKRKKVGTKDVLLLFLRERHVSNNATGRPPTTSHCLG